MLLIIDKIGVVVHSYVRLTTNFFFFFFFITSFFGLDFLSVKSSLFNSLICDARILLIEDDDLSVFLCYILLALLDRIILEIVVIGELKFIEV